MKKAGEKKIMQGINMHGTNTPTHRRTVTYSHTHDGVLFTGAGTWM